MIRCIAWVMAGLVMAALLAGCQTSRRGDVPMLVGAADLRGTINGPAVVYFTDEQWSLATSGLIEVTTIPEGRVQMEASPMPGGGMIVRPVRCPPGCAPVMHHERRALKPAPGDVSYTPHPDDVWIPACICEPSMPNVPVPGAGALPPCRIIFRRITQERPGRGIIVIQCEAVNCGATCHLVFRRQTNGLLQLACECR